MEERLSLTWKGRLIAIIIGFVLFMLAAEAVLRVAMPHWQEYYSGWFMRAINVAGHGRVSTGQPGFDGYFAQNNGDFRIHININEFGLRNNEPVDEADGRIWVVGDSMTFGWGVEENQIYASVIGDKLGSPTYNIASPGTDVCGYQALLARMPESVQPRAVVMGLILENDIHVYDCREKARREDSQSLDAKPTNTSLIAIKSWFTGHSAIYNFVAVSLKRVNVLREVLTSLGIVRPIDTYKNPLLGLDFEKAIQRSVAEIETLKKMIPEGTPFLVVIAPGRFELNGGDELYARLRKAMGTALGERGIDYVDPFEAFNEAGYAPTHFAHDGHWTVLGHRLAGTVAAKRLRTLLAP